MQRDELLEKTNDIINRMPISEAERSIWFDQLDLASDHVLTFFVNLYEGQEVSENDAKIATELLTKKAAIMQGDDEREEVKKIESDYLESALSEGAEQ